MIRMTPIEAQLPPSFYALPDRVYREALVRPRENAPDTTALLALARGADELLLFEGPNSRLLGIFKSTEKKALFAFWESLELPDESQALFTAFEQAARQRGCQRLEGPLHFNTFHRYRLRLNQPSWGQFDREPVNPLYYPALLEASGFVVDRRFESRLLRSEVVPVVYESKAQMLEAIHQLPYDFIPLNRDSWLAHEAAIYQLIGEIFGQNPGFRAISEAEFKSLYNPDFAEALCPHSSVLLADRASGDLLAISLCLPNYHPLNLRERPRFEAHYPRLKQRTLLAKTQGVHPAHRQKGLMNYLGVYGMLSFKQYYDEIIFCLMREDNPSLRFTDPFAHEKAVYASYYKDLG